MAATWSSESAGKRSCSKCNSVYEVTLQRLPARDSDYFNCEVCGHEMDRWNDTEYPIFKLVESGQVPPKSTS
jgi:hypothetical protein